jgi:hypothetical protein
MLGRSSRTSANSEPSEARQPLLSRSRDDLDEDAVLFSVADDDSDEGNERTALATDDAVPAQKGGERSVHFRETAEVRIFAPEWTQASREAGASPLRYDVQYIINMRFVQNTKAIRTTSMTTHSCISRPRRHPASTSAPPAAPGANRLCRCSLDSSTRRPSAAPRMGRTLSTTACRLRRSTSTSWRRNSMQAAAC